MFDQSSLCQIKRKYYFSATTITIAILGRLHTSIIEKQLHCSIVIVGNMKAA